MNRDPKNTFAIVTGVEKYDGREIPNLNGPAHDACQFATWLCQRQVPLENIRLFISPLVDKTGELALPNGLSYQTATEQNIRDCIENELKELTEKHYLDLLYFYWGGHGVMNTAGERRLIYADATFENKKNLDLNKLLNFLRTDYFLDRTLSQQIVIVDTCANYADKSNLAKLPSYDFPERGPLENREQYVLMAAKPGEFAKNLVREQTGLFTKELMVQLANQLDNEWPPEMKEVRAQLSQRFIALNQEGRSEQTPTYFYYRTWDSSEGHLGQVSTQPKPISSFLAKKKDLINSRLDNLQQRYEAVFTQRESTLNEGDKIPLKRQLEHLENQIKETESDLNQL